MCGINSLRRGTFNIADEFTLIQPNVVEPDIPFFAAHNDAGACIDIIRWHFERDEEFLPRFGEIEGLSGIFVPGIALVQDSHDDGSRFFALCPQIVGIGRAFLQCERLLIELDMPEGVPLFTNFDIGDFFPAIGSAFLPSGWKSAAASACVQWCQASRLRSKSPFFRRFSGGFCA